MVSILGAANQTITKKAVVVTGASTGIGEACARRLDKSGFRVFAGVRKAEDGHALKKISDQLVPVLIDVTDIVSIASAVETVTADVGEAGLAGLVNNAGIAITGPLEFLPISEFRKQLEVNVIGQIAATQAFLPLLRKGNGRIVNMGSMSGRLAYPFMGPYAASKFALEALTDSLRVELRPWGIAVSIIEPGIIVTPMREKSRAIASEIMKNLPPAAHDFYSSFISALHKTSTKMDKTGIPADVVAKAVEHALTAKNPKTRYLVGRRKAKFRMALFELIPDRLRDFLMTRRLT